METEIINSALDSCAELESSLGESLRFVQRLNLRYNTRWWAENHKLQNEENKPSLDLLKRKTADNKKCVNERIQKPKNPNAPATLNVQKQHVRIHLPRQRFKLQSSSPIPTKKSLHLLPIEELSDDLISETKSLQSLTDSITSGKKNSRTSLEICNTNLSINTKFIKVKRSMESLVAQMNRTMEKVQRQELYQNSAEITNFYKNLAAMKKNG